VSKQGMGGREQHGSTWGSVEGSRGDRLGHVCVLSLLGNRRGGGQRRGVAETFGVTISTLATESVLPIEPEFDRHTLSTPSPPHTHNVCSQ
jgi:hypothetical protein